MNIYLIIFLIIVVVVITQLLIYGRNLANNNLVTVGRFQKFTVIIAATLLLVIFVFIIGGLLYTKNDVQAETIVPQCPDFWEIEETTTGPKCVNVQDLGTCAAATADDHLTMDFNSGNFPDNCAKYTWANNCNIAWDGLTYGVSDPCVKA